MKIHKGDSVKLLGGRDAGKTGKVLHVDAKLGTIAVEGLNMVKHHSKPKRQGEKGQIINIPASFNVSKVMIVCPSCKAATRVGYRFEKDGKTKTRFCKKCNSAI